jgi:SNF2 family DNA or RNA helicase
LDRYKQQELDLISKQRPIVILCEPQIKPSLEVQAIARAHRMGQVRKVQVHRLILPDSVDEKMLAHARSISRMSLNGMPERVI